MEKSQSVFLSEIRDTLSELKAQIADIEAKLADFEKIEAEKPEPVPSLEDLPEDTSSWEPIDISIDIDPFGDLPAAEPAPAPEEQASAEMSGSAGPLPSDDGPLPLMMPRVAQFPQTPAPQDATPTQTPEPEPEPAPQDATPAPEPEPSLEDVFGAPVVKESINDRLEKKARKTVAEAMSDKCAWRTAIPGTPVKNIISAISLNDRILFINTLFKEDPAAFQQTISDFNSMESFAEAEAYVAERHPEWNLGSDTVYRLMMAVRRKLR